MTEILSRQQLVDALLPLLVEAGWQPLPVGAQTYVAVRGSWWLDFGHGSFNLDARDPEGYSAQIAGAEVGSVDQAVAYLRVAGVLPAEVSVPTDTLAEWAEALTVALGYLDTPDPALAEVLAVRNAVTRQLPRVGQGGAL